MTITGYIPDGPRPLTILAVAVGTLALLVILAISGRLLPASLSEGEGHNPPPMTPCDDRDTASCTVEVDR